MEVKVSTSFNMMLNRNIPVHWQLVSNSSYMILNTKTGIVCQPGQRKWSLKYRTQSHYSSLMITHITHFNAYYSNILVLLKSTSIITGPSQGKWINMPETAAIARLGPFVEKIIAIITRCYTYYTWLLNISLQSTYHCRLLLVLWRRQQWPTPRSRLCSGNTHYSNYALILILRNFTHHALRAAPPPFLPFPRPWQLRRPIFGCLEPGGQGCCWLFGCGPPAAAVAHASAMATQNYSKNTLILILRIWIYITQFYFEYIRQAPS